MVIITSVQTGKSGGGLAMFYDGTSMSIFLQTSVYIFFKQVFNKRCNGCFPINDKESFIPHSSLLAVYKLSGY